jgi:hypothetical protein
MNLEKMWKPAAIGGILLGVLSSIPPLNCACCIWILGGGFLAAYLYVKESSVVVTLGQGVLLGFIAGVIGTIIYALIQIPLFLLSSEGGQGLAEQIQQIMEQFPGFTEENQKSLTELTSHEGFISVLYVMSIAVWLVINCLLAMLGGALGVALFEKRKPQDPFTQESGGEPPSSLPPLPPSE